MVLVKLSIASHPSLDALPRSTSAMDGLDPSAKDGGLVECLTQSHVDKDLIQALINPDGKTRWRNIN